MLKVKNHFTGDYNTIYLFIFLSMDIWLVSIYLLNYNFFIHPANIYCVF